MNIDRKTMICGIPIIKIRDFLRRYRTPWSFSIQDISEHYNLTEEKGTILVDELLKSGYIEDGDNNDYQVSVRGNALALTKFVSRINKIKADRIFDEFMSRVRLINEDDKYIYRISRLFLFGSYLDPQANDFGDIDIAYELERKIADDKVFHTECQKIINDARENGRIFSSIVDEICYPQTLILRFLKNRSPYISLHRAEEITVLSAPHRQIFP